MQIEGYDYPDDLYYHKEHTWIKPEGGGRARVGMTDFYQKLSGEIVYVDLPFEGDEVSEGETVGKLQSSKWVGKIVSPLSGTIAEVNSALEDTANLINKSPYGDGWIMVIEASDLDSQLAGLMKIGDIPKYLEGEKERVEREKQKK